MRYLLIICLLSVSVFASEDDVALPGRSEVRQRISFNADWKFFRCGKMPDRSEQEEPTGLEKREADDSKWRNLNLPHDWALEGPFHNDESRWGNLPYEGIGWYRKHFKVSAADKNKRIFIDFDGAMSNARIWLNGVYIGERPYGYASFRLELTEHLKVGQENVLAVRLQNLNHPTRWYPGAGINRNVWLVKTSPVHVDHWGVFVTTPKVSDRKADVAIEVTLNNQMDKASKVEVSAEIFELTEKPKLVAATKVATGKLKAGTKKVFELDAKISDPKRWDVDTPNLYCAHVIVKADGKVVDSYTCNFGVRTIDYSADKGFFLNGKHIKFKGMCLHDDYGAMGIETNRSALEYYLGKMKEMGCNAIRMAHKPSAPELLDLCDRMGLMVMGENFDEWAMGKKESPNGYHNIFEEWGERDTRTMVRRDRNHPSIVIWSCGNEMPEQKSPDCSKIAARLRGYILDEDPTRPVTAACNKYDESVKNKIWEGLDVMGFNYKAGNYRKFHEQYPDVPITGTENIGTFSSRGEYFFPLQPKTLKIFDWQITSYALQHAPWGCRIETEFEAQDQNPYVFGFFFWTGIDYRGEPGPEYLFKRLTDQSFPDLKLRAKWQQQEDKAQLRLHSGYNGSVDLCGFEKDMFYLFQSWFLPEKPMAHLLPHWTWPEREGKNTPVHLFTSGDEAELFLNGKSLGRRKKEEFQYRMVWDKVLYQPGELKVIVYKNGKKWAEDIRRTAGAPAKIALYPHKTELNGDGYDLSFVKVAILDKDGNLCPRADNLVKFDVTGPGRIDGVENGDSSCFEPVKNSKQRSAFNGLCQVVLRSINGKKGRLVLRAEADGLKAAEVTVTVGE